MKKYRTIFAAFLSLSVLLTSCDMSQKSVNAPKEEQEKKTEKNEKMKMQPKGVPAQPTEENQ